jgi:glycosyltransferase
MSAQVDDSVRNEPIADTPLLSIVTVCRNSARHIGEMLQSVDASFGGDESVEHLIVDGLSTDDTVAVIQEFARPCRRLVSEADTGVYDGMNKGLRCARGEYVWFLNSDDLIHAEVSCCASEVLRVLRGRRPPILIGEVQMFKETASGRRPSRYWRVPADVEQARRFGWHPPHPAFIAQRRFLAGLGGFDETKRIAADFKLMTVAMRSAKGEVAIIARPLVAMREGGVSNGSVRAILDANRECYAALRELGLSPARAAAGIGIKLARKAGQKFVSARRSPSLDSR